MTMKVEKIDSLDLAAVRKVLTSSEITDTQKTQFLRTNKSEILSLVETKISGTEYEALMANRPLIKFKPLKNSLTKAGDKKLLAKTLNIKPILVDSYISDATTYLKSTEGYGKYSKDELEAIKTYVYRHGTKQQVIDFLDYELTYAKDVLTTLYHTLDYHSGGVADYFIRPIHRMDNVTMYNIYNTVDKHLRKCEESGEIDAQTNRQISEWALAKIYSIQNNSKLINAIKTYRKLKY